jgi:zinc protease
MINAGNLYNKLCRCIINNQSRNHETAKTQNYPMKIKERIIFVCFLFRSFVLSCFRDYNLQFAICNLQFAFILFTLLSATAFAEIPMDRVVALPVESDPTVCFRLWFQVGSQNDPPGKEGLAALTASMITEASTKTNSYEDILDLLFPMAGTYAAEISVEETVVYGRIHKDNLQQYYKLLLQAVMEPAFKQDDLDRLKSDAINHLENTLRYSSDEELGKAVLYDTIYRGTPYGHLPIGLIESLRNITVEDVKNFHRKYFTRDNVIIGIGGGYDSQMMEKIRTDLAALPAGKPQPVPMPSPQKIEGLQIKIVEKDCSATAISMGFPIDVLRGDKDWYALAVANSWLGEHRSPSSHLYNVLREIRGLNYGDYSYIEHFPNGGALQLPPQNVARRRQIFEIWIRPVPNAARQFALRGAMREFEHLVNDGLTQSEFDLTRNFLHNYVLHYAPTTMDRLAYAMDDKFYNIPGSHLELYRKKLEQMTLPEVNAAVKKYWQYKNMQIVIVTKDAKALKEALISNAPSPYTYPTQKPESVLEEDKQISTFKLDIKPENVKLVPVGELFEK